jgi:hypothetical protein
VWDKLWPGQIPPSPVELDIIETRHADTNDSTVLHG